MNSADYSGALEYARKRLSNDLPPNLHYHNLDHTFAEVLPAAMFLASQTGIGDEDRQLLRVAAAFHDIGWVVQGKRHEIIGVEICHQRLPTLSFSSNQIEKISGMIMATRLPQSPKNELQEILADADMFTLGSDDFWSRNADLRNEIEARGIPIPDLDWYGSQLEFLQVHQYHTVAARADRDLRKKGYIAELRRILSQDDSSSDTSQFPPLNSMDQQP